jgi:hypothetical protein
MMKVGIVLGCYFHKIFAGLNVVFDYLDKVSLINCPIVFSSNSFSGYVKREELRRKFGIAANTYFIICRRKNV